jgi:hypothetical protein
MVAGTPTRSIAARFGVSQSALLRHTHNHPTVSLVKVTNEPIVLGGDDTVSTQLASLLKRSLSAVDAAEKSGSLNQSALHFKELRATIVAIGAWQEQQARLAASRRTETVVDLMTTPEWIELRTVLMGALMPMEFAKARLAVAAALHQYAERHESASAESVAQPESDPVQPLF